MILYQNQFVPKDKMHISFEDRGYYFGDGVYEVFRIYRGKLFEKQAHMRRLVRSAGEIRLRLPYSTEEIEEKLESLVIQEQIEEGTLYMQITRGIAPRAHVFPKNAEPVLMAYCNEVKRPLGSIKEGITAVSVEDIRWHRCDIKSLNLLGNVLAKQEAVERGAGEAILHRSGRVTECSASNVMMVKDGVIYTHPADNCILHGVTRAVVLKLARQEGLEIREEARSLEDFLQADEAFITGTTVEITPIIRIDGQAVGTGRPGPLTVQLQSAFEKAIIS
ncbi:D-amino-acid transaminase [Ferviditalea candida]|uniref:D-alanine aminotransferase n=1 Tax=Ferviditalea candida TaxID=3108399 RepID=A0ABU5ZD75_9BACL|nr:D-amino-acid transaminase [Paenibacillaceae bacterium T2]